jgi:hypothetical protein
MNNKEATMQYTRNGNRFEVLDKATKVTSVPKETGFTT